MIKILEKNGIDNTNIDGAGFNRFCAGDRDGIIKGRLNECAIAAQGNTLTIGTGEMLVSGFRVVLDTPTTFTMSSAPSVAMRYQLIAEVVVDGNSVPTFEMRTQLVAELTQEPIFAKAAGTGTYQVEICRFTHSTSGAVTNIEQTLGVIVGGITNIFVGETITGAEGSQASVRVEKEFDKQTLFFTIPRGETGKNIELQANGDWVQWRNEGDTAWKNLFKTSDIKPSANAVLYESQTLSEAQRSQARKNIGAGSSNPNLLINGDFRINQRGITTRTDGGYLVDRFQCFFPAGAQGSIEQTSDGVKITSAVSGKTIVLRQTFDGENIKKIAGKTVTISAKIKDFSIASGSGFLNVYGNNTVLLLTAQINANGVFSATGIIPSETTTLFLQFSLGNIGSYTAEWVKMEVGSVATDFVPRTYEEELALCQRYYIDLVNLNDTTSAANVFGTITTTGTFGYAHIPLPVTMRKRGTLIAQSQNLIANISGENRSVTATALYSFSNGGITLRLTGTFANGETGFLQTTTRAAGVLAIDAEL